MTFKSDRIRTLVTGGAGFIGSHLCDRLVESDHHVVCVDNFYTGQRRNIAHLLDNPNFELIEHDIVEPLQVDADEIYNLACPASPVHYQADPIQTWKTSVLGSLNMLELARNLNARILQASTSEVYGDPHVHPQPESYWGNVNPIGPRACYDEGKRAAETLFFDYNRRYGVEIKVVRIFNTYGPRMHPEDGRVVSNFIVQALKGKDITVYGDGTQTRSFCYVNDLVEGLLRAMASKPTIIGPINLGNPNEFTVGELAEKVLALVGPLSSVEYCLLPVDDPKKRQPDISAASTTLGWEPSIKLDDGLVATIAFFRRELAEPAATIDRV